MDLDALAREGDLDDKRLLVYLDTLDYPRLVGLLQAPAVVTEVHLTPTPRTDAGSESTWGPGEPRPALADEDPAVMLALARCAMARWRGNDWFGGIVETVTHDRECGWCAYPATELLRALAWAEHFARFIVSEAWVWQRGRAAYRRSTGRRDTYENVAWQTFAALPSREQRYLVDRAVEASRPTPDESAALPSTPREHPPWCDLRSDHAGECPALTEE